MVRAGDGAAGRAGRAWRRPRSLARHKKRCLNKTLMNRSAFSRD